MNNAGVTLFGYVWDVPVRDWEWTIHANLMSHVYFMKLVIPIMLKQKTHCHIVNTVSVAGVLTSSGASSYHATKHAAIALSECVSYDLQAIGADISYIYDSYRETCHRYAERKRAGSEIHANAFQLKSSLTFFAPFAIYCHEYIVKGALCISLADIYTCCR